jgi:hypothetical protein
VSGKPPQKRLVPYVHAEGDLWLLSVAAEMTFGNQQAKEET